jgi:hypothetical protein
MSGRHFQGMSYTRRVGALSAGAYGGESDNSPFPSYPYTIAFASIPTQRYKAFMRNRKEILERFG